jgi:ribosomal protein L37AE/L43A
MTELYGRSWFEEDTEERTMKVSNICDNCEEKFEEGHKIEGIGILLCNKCNEDLKEEPQIEYITELNEEQGEQE